MQLAVHWPWLLYYSANTVSCVWCFWICCQALYTLPTWKTLYNKLHKTIKKTFRFFSIKWVDIPPILLYLEREKHASGVHDIVYMPFICSYASDSNFRILQIPAFFIFTERVTKKPRSDRGKWSGNSSLTTLLSIGWLLCLIFMFFWFYKNYYYFILFHLLSFPVIWIP